ncbi:hypothetical protein [Streptomyces microflavus]|uniref:hypothetical protein n=1 Tax=Streptomyces microflavus TaxID=1919 RepID=UPI00340FAD55
MQIERACGVSPAAVARLLNGQKRIFLENEKKILAVPLSVRVDLGDVPACGAVRRVRALYALGHFNLQIAAAAGMSRDAIGHLAAGRYQTLKVKADDGIRAAYDQLSMQAGSSWKTRKLAEERGWAPPLAWDDDTIDDPAAVPQLDAPQAGFTEGDDVANRFLMGESVVLDREARRAVICHLMEWSTETPEEIGSRLEMSEGAVSQVWVRVKREARIAGQPVPWRRVYVSLSEMNLTKDDLRSAA